MPSKIYRLNFLKKHFKDTGPNELYQAKFSNENNDIELYSITSDGHLQSYNYNNKDGKWNKYIIQDKNLKGIKQLYFADIFDKGQDILLLKNKDNIKFLQFKNRKLELINKINMFDDFYDWSLEGNFIKFGHFYVDHKQIGIFTKHEKYGFKFYGVIKDEIYNEDPIWDDEAVINIANGNNNETKFYFNNIIGKKQDNVIVQSQDGIDIYKFNEQHLFQNVMHISCCIPDINNNIDKLFFSYISGSKYKDIIHLNSTGLYLHNYDKDNNYKFLNYNPLFSTDKGWLINHSNSIKFKDINFDGIHEIIFNGPQGISILKYNSIKNNWESILDTSNINIDKRNGQFINVFPDFINPMMFIYSQNTLYIAEIKEYLKYNIINDNSNTKKTDIPSNDLTRLRMVPKEKEKDILYLSDQLLDYTMFQTAVQGSTGKLRYTLPLIDMPELYIKLKLIYDSTTSDILGHGWSIPSTFIMLDHQSSVFFEDHHYYVSYENNIKELMFEYYNEKYNIYTFSIKDYLNNTETEKNITIKYYKNEEKWIINNENLIQTFGNNNNRNSQPIQWEKVWQNWYGAANTNKTDQQIELPIGWFLSEVRDDRGNTINYNYISKEIKLSDIKTINDIYLKQITDKFENSLILNYKKLTKNEINIVEKNTKKQNNERNYYLADFELNTKRFRQNVEFKYITNKENTRLLCEIVEKNLDPVFQFYYNENDLLERVKLPLGANIIYKYENIYLPNSTSTISTPPKVIINKNYNVHYGNDYILLSYVNIDGKLEMKIYDKNLNNILYSYYHTGDHKLPAIGNKPIMSHTVIEKETFITIMIMNEDKTIELYLFYWQDNKLLTKPTNYKFNENSIIKIGDDFILAIHNGNLLIIEWDVINKKWIKNILKHKKTYNDDVSLILDNRVFAIYDNQILELWYRDFEKKWHSSFSKYLPNFLSNINESLNKFNINDDMKKYFKTISKNSILQMNENIITLSTWYTDQEQFHSDVYLCVLNNKYNIFTDKYIKIEQDNINTFFIDKHDIETDNKLKFSYTMNNGKYNVFVNLMSGPMLDEVEKQRKEITRRIKDLQLSQEDEQKQLNELNEKLKEVDLNITRNIVENSNRSLFLIDYTKYTGYLKLQTEIIGDNTYKFNGIDWEYHKYDKKIESLKIDLGLDYLLEQDMKNVSIKLYRKNDYGEKINNIIYDFGINDINQVVLKYPIYLAYQRHNNPPIIIIFEKNNSIPISHSLESYEELKPGLCGPNTVVTQIDYNSDDFVALKFRNIVSTKHLLPDTVVKEVIIQLNDNESNYRKTGYNYDVTNTEEIFSGILYKKVNILPGNDKLSFGWIEDYTNETNTIRSVFNGDGKIIKQVIKDIADNEAQEEEKEALDRNATLFDKDNRLPLAKFFPYHIDSGYVSYYGFEDYELNKIGNNNNKWEFNENDIIKNLFPLTGNNFLFLPSDQVLKGNFDIDNQNLTFIASTWVRPNFNMPPIGSVVPYLKINVKDDDNNENIEFMSEIKLISEDWYYLESIVNIYYAKLMLKNKNLPKNIKISVIVNSDNKHSMHVDHLRFTPINCQYETFVYDKITTNVLQEIKHNGEINRYIYDKYNEKIATINNYGQLIDFITYTKITSKSNLIQQPNSYLNMQSASGFYENFSSKHLNKNWIIKDIEKFQISYGFIQHLTKEIDNIQLKSFNINKKTSFGLRLYYYFTETSSFLKINNEIQLFHSNHKTELIFFKKIQHIPPQGEFLLFVEGNRFFIWIDGGLYIDDDSKPILQFNDDILIDISMQNAVKLTDVMILDNILNLQVNYFNKLGEKIQEIKLEDDKTVIVTSFLYDQIGRQSITTKPVRIKLGELSDKLLAHLSIINNINPYDDNSVWKTGELKGLAVERSLLDIYDFSEITYHNNPLDEEYMRGLPGKEFSIQNDKYFKKTDSTVVFIINELFPERDGFRYITDHKAGNVLDITVFDKHNNKAAWYIHVPNGNGLLTTFKYDNKNRLIQKLPPIYHERAKTLLHINKLTTDNDNLPLQLKFGTFITYDDNDNIKTKITPDTAKIENIYDNYGLLRFIIHYSDCIDGMRTIDSVTYFNYDEFLRIINTGSLLPIPSNAEELLKINYNFTNNYQEFYYNDGDSEPNRRGKLKRIITYNYKNEPFIEELLENEYKKVINKRIVLPIGENQVRYIDINKRYVGNQLKIIEYPFNIDNKPLILIYEYNRQGKIKEIGIPSNTSMLFTFTYNTFGLLTSEIHYHHFNRNYYYNSAGFLINIDDKYLNEEIYYTEPGYGGYGFRDGTVTRTKFTAKWHNYSTIHNISLNEKSFIRRGINSRDSKLCFDKLKENGYIDELNHQNKLLYPDLDINLPIVCSMGTDGRYVANILGKNGFPKSYGYIYDYGNYMELTKAKYYVGNEIPKPLQPDSFSKAWPKLINTTTSENIWKILIENSYIAQDQDKLNLSTAHAKRRNHFLRLSLDKDLNNRHILSIRNLLANCYSENKIITYDEFLNIYQSWIGIDLTDLEQAEAKEIYAILSKNKYLKDPMAPKFINALLSVIDKQLVPNVVKVLLEHFGKELGQAEFDSESYSIDSHGNHRLFYIGFNRVELNYEVDSNKIHSIKIVSFKSLEPFVYYIKYDNKGNVIKATHKQIKYINYDPVLNRANRFELKDGTNVILHYDSKGERVLKKVLNKNGEIMKEIQYIRDEHGRSLVEKEITYITQDQPPDVLLTAYIYGPNGLIGFIRRNEFYSVIVDHTFSVRLVVKNREVVAAYDYLPYGSLMREYASYPEAHIRYRFTGQEWDDELKLYNYHARFYDPIIGRFYQIDPKEQYINPYLYAGNSPVSYIDPDGQEAITIILAIIFALGGAYLGAAAANNTFDLTKWDWTSLDTWLGLIFGAVAGATLPLGAIGSIQAITTMAALKGAAVAYAYVGVIALGLGGAYLGMAAANDNQWDPSKWDFTSPKTYYGAFQGFAVGAGSIGSLYQAHTLFITLSKVGKGIFIAGSVLNAGVLFYSRASQANFDPTKPGFWFGIFDAFTHGPDKPLLAHKVYNNRHVIASVIQNTRNHLKEIISSISTVFKNPGWISTVSVVTPVIGASVITGVTAGYYDLTGGESTQKWSITTVSSYGSTIDSLYEQSKLASVNKHFYKTNNIKERENFGSNLITLPKHIVTETKTDYEKLLNDIQNQIYNPQNSENTDKLIESNVAIIKQQIENGGSLKKMFTIGKTDKFTISVYSQNGKSEVVMIFPHQTLSSPSVMYKGDLDIKTNKYLMDRILDVQKGIKQSNLMMYESEIKTITKILDNLENLNNQTKENIINNLKNLIIEHGYLKNGKHVITDELNSYIHETINNKIKNIQEFIEKHKQIFEEKINETQGKYLSENLKAIRQHIAAKQNEITNIEYNITQNINTQIDHILKQFHIFEKYMKFWAPINNDDSIVSSKYFKCENLIQGFIDLSNDLRSLTNFADGELIAPMEECNHCNVIPKRPKNYINDPLWTDVLNRNLLPRKVIEKDVTNITIPCNALDEIHIKQTKSENITTRQKRSISHIKNSKTTSTFTKNNKSHFSNFYNWLKSFTSWRNNDLPSNSSEKIDTKSNNTSTITSTDEVDVQGNLLLANVFVSKLFKTKLNNVSANNNFTYEEALGHALNITDYFENEIRGLFKKYGLSDELILIDFIDVQNNVMKKIISNKLHEIPAILNTYITKQFSQESNFNHKNHLNKFNGAMTKFINKFLNKMIHDMLKKYKKGYLNYNNHGQETFTINNNNKTFEISSNSLDNHLLTD